MCEDSKCTCPSMKPGATSRPLRSCVSSAFANAPRGCTLAIISPTIPMSASRSSSVATSTIRPPVSSRSNGSLPWAAAIALTRVCRSMASIIVALFRLDVGRLDDGCILLDFLGQEGGKFSRAGAYDAQIDVGQLGFHLRFLHQGRNLTIEPVDDRGVGFGRREHAVPDRDVDILQRRLFA